MINTTRTTWYKHGIHMDIDIAGTGARAGGRNEPGLCIHIAVWGGSGVVENALAND